MKRRSLATRAAGFMKRRHGVQGIRDETLYTAGVCQGAWLSGYRAAERDVRHNIKAAILMCDAQMKVNREIRAHMEKFKVKEGVL